MSSATGSTSSNAKPSSMEKEQTDNTCERDPTMSRGNFSSTFHEAIFILIIGLSQLFSVGGLGNTGYSVEQIGQSLSVTSNGQQSWFLAAYSLSGGVVVLITGRLGDHFGHKYVFLFGWIWMAIWSLASGFAHNAAVFDFTRAMTGIGNGALVPNSFALIARAFPPLSVKKNIAFAFLGFCAPAGYIFGGLIGAAFAEKVTWRWGFWFWAIGCFVLAVATIIAIPHRVGSAVPGLKRFDYLGAFLAVAGPICFAFAWNQAAVVGWHEPYTYALLIVGIILIIAFIFSQFHAAVPVLPNSLWSRNGFTSVVAAMALGWMSFGIFLYYTTIFILDDHSAAPLTAVAQMTPLVIGGLVATGSVGIFIPRVPAQYILGVSMLSFMIGNLLMSFATYSPVYWAFIFPACLLVVGGPDLSFASAGILISNAVLSDEQGVAGSFVSTVVQYSIAVGLGIAGVVEAYTGPAGYRGAYWLGIGFAVLGLLVVVGFVKDHRFDDSAAEEAEKDSGAEEVKADV